MARQQPERERRIQNEIVVDAYDEQERAIGWYYYLSDKLEFPFFAKCVAETRSSPLTRSGSTREAIEDWHYWLNQGYTF